ncbi:MAG: hypothetical protein ABJ251_06755 [Paracoccaceae bacterium]
MTVDQVTRTPMVVTEGPGQVEQGAFEPPVRPSNTKKDPSKSDPVAEPTSQAVQEQAEDAEDTYAFLAEDAVNGDEAAQDSLAVAVTGKTYEELEQSGEDIEFMGFLKDVASRRIRPEIRVAGRDDGQGIESKTTGDWLPSGVNGAYVPGEAGTFDPGTILVAQGLEGDELRETMLEEYGEALAELATESGVHVHEGDAGARLAMVAGAGEGSLQKAAGNPLFTRKPQDETTVVLNGRHVTAKADASAAYVPASENDAGNIKSAVGFDSFMNTWGESGATWGQEGNVVTAVQFAKATGISQKTADSVLSKLYPDTDVAYFTQDQIRSMMADGLIDWGVDYSAGGPVTLNTDALDGGRVANVLADGLFEAEGYAPTTADNPMNHLVLQAAANFAFGNGSLSEQAAIEIVEAAVEFSPQRTAAGVSIRDIKNFVDMGYIDVNFGNATTGPTITTEFPEDVLAAGAALLPSPHTEPGFWQNIWGDVADPAKLVTDIASFAGHAEADVAKFLNNQMDHAEALEKGMHKAIIAFGQEVQKGTASALHHLESFGSAIKSGLGNLTASAGKYVDHLVQEAKKAGGELALHALMALSGMSKQEANSMLHEMSEKFDLLHHLRSLTLDDVSQMVPNFDEIVELGTALQNEFAATAAQGGTETTTTNDPEMTAENAFTNLPARRLMSAQLEETGMEVTTEGQVLNPDGTVATDEDLQNWYDQHMRLDIAPLELNGVWAKRGLGGAGIDVHQLRPFITMPRHNEDGELMMEFRLRELDLTGVAGGTGAAQGDFGLLGVRDFIVPFHVDGAKAGQMGELQWVDTTGVILEWTPQAGPLGNNIGNMLQGDLFGFGQTFAGFWGDGFDQQAAVQQGGRISEAMQKLQKSVGEDGSLEIGGGLGFSTSYNLDKLGGHWWAPMAAEIAGAVAGGGIGAGILGAMTAGSDGALAPLVKQIGPAVVQGVAKLGAMAADMIYSRASGSSVETSFGVFGWGAYLHTWGAGDRAGGANAKIRSRVQANFAYDEALGF